MYNDIPLISERRSDEPEYVAPIQVGFGYPRDPVPDDAASEKAGYPVFKDVVFCLKVVPGDTHSVACQPATDNDKKLYPRAWAAFQERDTKPIQGMPIEQWTQITRAMATSLRAMHIHTVESLADLHDGNIGNLGQMGRELRAKAKAFLVQAKDTAAASAFAAENERLNAELAETRRQIAQLAGRLQNVEQGEPQRRGPGRPRKHLEEPTA